ncbi:hypothetical protein EHM76_02945 [bacterium]|nr:MAG: hypothetical protein EHM76_02945 [bacterium]
MSIKIDLTASDVDKQMEVLKHFPDLAEKHYRPVVKRDVDALRARIQPEIPIRSGKAASTFGSKVTGRAFSLKGQVGWYDSGDPWYINVVEHGAVAHDINVKPKQASVLAWNGNFSMGHRISHPGFSARGFMAAGYSAMQPVIENDLAMANERIIADLAAI